jgi:hypothetical protein
VAEEIKDDLSDRLLAILEVVDVLAGLELGKTEGGLHAHRRLLVARAVEESLPEGDVLVIAGVRLECFEKIATRA